MFPDPSSNFQSEKKVKLLFWSQKAEKKGAVLLFLLLEKVDPFWKQHNKIFLMYSLVRLLIEAPLDCCL